MKHKYEFSIIMPVYNVEMYLEESIQSLIDQTLDFRSNVELILINDCSSDGSHEICKKYSEDYENIKYVSRDTNGGLSQVRNDGIEIAEGRILTFMDSDDIYLPNTLKKVSEYFNDHNLEIVTLGIRYFERLTHDYPRYKIFEKTSQVVDMNIDPDKYFITSAATFYSREVIGDNRFEIGMQAEDFYFNTIIFKHCQRFGYIYEDDALYMYRQRIIRTSIIDKTGSDDAWFVKNFEYLYRKIQEYYSDCNEFPDFIKNMLLYELGQRFKRKNVPTSINKSTMYNLYAEILENLSYQMIADNPVLAKNGIVSMLYLKATSEKNENVLSWNTDGELCVDNVDEPVVRIDSGKFHLHQTTFYKSGMYMSGLFLDLIPNDFQIYVETMSKRIDVKVEPIENCVYSRNVLDFEIYPAYKISLTIPYEEDTYALFVEYKGVKHQIMFLPQPRCFYAIDLKNITAYSKYYKFKYTRDSIVVSKRTFMSKFFNNIKTTLRIKKWKKFNAWYRLFDKIDKKYILISDRPEKGKDNGEALFKYIMENEHELAKNTYYVIKKSAKDYNDLREYKNVIDNGSYKHKILFINAKAIISSHLHPKFYSPFSLETLKKYRDLIRYKLVFLQHGVIYNDVSRAINKYSQATDMFVTSTKDEYDEISSMKYMYDKDDVQLTGLPRFDLLNDYSINKITIMPTWRSHLSGPINKQGFHDTVDGFIDSDYYKNYMSVLTDARLINKMREKQYFIDFVLHPGFRGYYDEFVKFENDVVKIHNPEDTNYSEIICSSKMLVTDFSSVFFDFAYMKKPQIYFQFDRDDFYNRHYKKGYFDLEKDGFGPVCSDVESLVEEIIKYADTDFKVDNKYMQIIESTFSHFDNNNSKRTVEAIKVLLDK